MNASWLSVPLALLLAPLVLGVVNRTKAFFAGRTGQPLLQVYFDILKLLRKGAVYSRTTTWVFRAGPLVTLAALLTLVPMTPLGGQQAPLSFTGDIIVFCALLGLARFFTILAALDTGSAFEGMGASREALFGALAEPALYLALAALVRHTQTSGLSESYGFLSRRNWMVVDPAVVLVAVALFGVFLVENCRIPVDDPNTHLELTMIHEVMVLDHSGPDFAFVLWGSALRAWILGCLVAGIAVPAVSFNPWLNVGLGVIGVLGLAVAVGVIESVMARLRMTVIPHLLVGSAALAATALLLGMR
ncbi:MAG: hydrogenase [Acidobacteria bacterium]|nr:MAG: hydrogenase [Acidobacteriota bacterium]